ncbi:MAG: hydantoinase/oxoprolinase N-terminal domain-containing protein, partial [Candidatus Rokuibacteriota bacterium]
MYRIGIDVGGTFTDLVAVDDAGRVTLAKAASTPADPSIGVMDGLDLLARTLGLDRPALLRATERIVHGTTVATNALLERKGARVGLLTTEGHRDVIEMREGLKDDRYNLRMPAPEPLVPRARRLGVRERMRWDGRVQTKLDRASLDAAIARLKASGVEAVAVCYLHAYRD